MVVVMPSYIEHEVTEVKMQEEDMNKGLGRYCVSKFIDYKQG